MAKKLFILQAAFLLTISYAVPASAELALEKDKKTNEVTITGEDPSKDDTGWVGEDHISKNELPADERLKKYIADVNEAVGYIQRASYKEAVQKLRVAIALDPSLPYAYDNLGNAYYHLRKYKKAMAMSKKALRIDPTHANAYGNVGSIYYALGKHKEAKINYEKAKKLFLKKGDLEGIARTNESLAQSFK